MVVVMYIRRDLEDLVRETSSEYAAVLVSGARQVGKSTMLVHLIDEMEPGLPGAPGTSPREVVTLDDLSNRALAREDPVMFFQLHKPPVLVDEVQYAPELFGEVKRLVDAGAPPGSFWLTGSQPFRLMQLAGESLAGRVAVLSLTSLSQHELHAASKRAGSVDVTCPPRLRLDLDALQERAASFEPADVDGMYERMFRGSMPAVVSGEKSNLSVFYSSYVQTYLERDVRDLAGDVESLPFFQFLTATAARCSQALNVASIANDIGERPETVRGWLSILERSGVIFYLHPYSNNQLTRTVKAPKLYFNDCGLVAYLTRWESPRTLSVGVMSGALMENYVVSEVRKGYLNEGTEPLLYYYRDRDAREVDLVLEEEGELHPIEIKRSASPNKAMIGGFRALDRGSVPRGTGALVCMAGELGALDSQDFIVPAWMV